MYHLARSCRAAANQTGQSGYPDNAVCFRKSYRQLFFSPSAHSHISTSNIASHCDHLTDTPISKRQRVSLTYTQTALLPKITAQIYECRIKAAKLFT